MAWKITDRFRLNDPRLADLEYQINRIDNEGTCYGIITDSNTELTIGRTFMPTKPQLFWVKSYTRIKVIYLKKANNPHKYSRFISI